jgi:hypothetical protein
MAWLGRATSGAASRLSEELCLLFMNNDLPIKKKLSNIQIVFFAHGQAHPFGCDAAQVVRNGFCALLFLEELEHLRQVTLILVAGLWHA